MSTDSEHAVHVLNSLIETTLDSAKGYKEAAENSKDSALKTLFSERSLQRMKLTGELQREVRTFGGDPEQHRSAMGKVHNSFVDLKAAVMGHDQKAIINEVDRGEDFLRGKYEHAVKDDRLPAPVLELVRTGLDAINADHVAISALKKAAS